MRIGILASLLLVMTSAEAQFSFVYNGPDSLYVDTSCTAILDWGHPETPQAFPTMPGQVVISFELTSISGGYMIGDPVPAGEIVTVFYTARDNMGQIVMFGFNLPVVDTIPPEVDPATIQDITVTCGSDAGFPDIMPFDNCDSVAVSVTDSGSIASSCAGGMLSRTITLTDQFGNTTEYTQLITAVPDTVDPEITGFPVDGSADCGEAMGPYSNWIDQQRQTFSATDGGCGIMEISDNAPPAGVLFGFCGEIVVEFVARDSCDNQSTTTATFFVNNEVTPMINVEASDDSTTCDSGDPLTQFDNWIATHGGAQAVDDCSLISWSTDPPDPSLSDVCNGVIDVTFIADDGCGNTVTTSAQFIVSDSTPPFISEGAADRVVNCAAQDFTVELATWISENGDAVAEDLCTASDDLAVTYLLAGQPIDSSGIVQAFTDSIMNGCVDNVVIGGLLWNNVLAYLEIEFQFADACGNAVSTMATFGITDAGGPEFVDPPQDMIITCAGADLDSLFGAWYISAGHATAEDDCGSVFFRGSPSQDDAFAVLQGALDTACGSGALVDIAFYVNDFCGNENPDSLVATFGVVDSLGPEITVPPSNAQFDCSGDIEEALIAWLDTLGGAQASDVCQNLTWTFEWEDSPGDTLSGIQGTGPYPDPAIIDCGSGLEVTFRASDICDNTDSATATFTFVDTIAPVIGNLDSSINVPCDSVPGVAQVTATDNCTQDPFITFSDIVMPDTDPDCGQFAAMIIRTWIATDNCGNSSTVDQMIEINDSEPPSFEAPADTAFACTLDVDPLLTGMPANVTDNCDPAPLVTYSDSVTGTTCNQLVERTWIVTDACGNSLTALQTISVTDTVAPEALAGSGELLISCDPNVDVDSAFAAWIASGGGVQFGDDCGTPSYFIAQPGSYQLDDTTTYPGVEPVLPTASDCGNDDQVLLEVIADLVVYDACANANLLTARFALLDTVAPEISGCTDTISVPIDTVTCEAMFDILVPMATDICSDQNQTGLSFAYDVDGEGRVDLDTSASLQLNLEAGMHLLTFYIADCSGNEDSCVTVLLAVDSEPPVLECPGDVTVMSTATSCSGQIAIPPPQAADNCGTGDLYYFITGSTMVADTPFPSDMDTVFEELGAGTSNIHLVVTDQSDNRDTCIWTALVTDDIPPQAMCRDTVIYIHPAGNVPADIDPQAIDNGSADNCSLDTLIVDPVQFNCSEAGTDQIVTLVAADVSGNRDSCTATVTLVVADLEPTFSAGVCDGDTLKLFANVPDAPGDPYSFNWSGPNGFTSDEENPLIVDPGPAQSGAYVLEVIGEGGCMSSGSVEITIEDFSTPDLSASAAVICIGDNVTLASSTYSQQVTYNWFRGVFPNGLLLGSTIEPSFVDTPPTTGEYNYYVIVEATDCSSNPSEGVLLEVVTAPEAMVNDQFIEVCEGGTIELGTDISGPNVGYIWTGPGGYSSDQQFPDPITDVTTSNAGIYSLVITLDDCMSEAASSVVVVNAAPGQPAITGDSVFCLGGDLMLLVENIPNADQYIWRHPNGSSIPTPANFLTISGISADVGGEWTVTAMTNGCQSVPSEPFLVVVESALVINADNTGPVCGEDDVTLLAQIIPGAIYMWNGPNGFTSTEANPTTPAFPGIYTVTVTTSVGCTASSSTTVEINNPPQINALNNTAGNCADGTSDLTFAVTTFPEDDGSFSYQWFGPMGFTSTDSMPVIENFTAADNGVYSLVITQGSCVSDTATTVVDVVNVPQKPVINGDTNWCENDTLLLMTQEYMGDMVVYSWNTPGGNVDVTGDPQLMLNQITSTATGQYSVVVSVDGCPSLPSDTVEVFVEEALPQPVAAGPELVCLGDSINLSTPLVSGATYQWNGPNGFTSSVREPLIYPATTADAGAYTVIVSVGPCTSTGSEPLDVEVIVPPTAPVIEPFTGSICLDDLAPVTLCIDSGSATSGASYTWLHMTSGVVLVSGTTDLCVTISDFSAFTEGTNAITVAAVLEGCEGDPSASLSIEAFTYPEVSAEAGADRMICVDEEFVLNAVPPPLGSGRWYSPDARITFSDESDPSATVDGLSEGENLLIWALDLASCTGYSEDTLRIIVQRTPELVEDNISVGFGMTTNFNVISNDLVDGEYMLSIVQEPSRGNVLHQGEGQMIFTPDIGYVGQDEFVYEVCSAECPLQCAEMIVRLEIGSENDCFVPTIFTPNEDGVNDLLIIPCLETERFPNNRVIIFNVWGDAVFDDTGYENDWDGTRDGKDLPVGTYYYVIDFGDGTPVRKGFIVIER